MNENEEKTHGGETPETVTEEVAKAEQSAEDTLPEIVNRIRSEYETKIEAITERHTTEIKERDEIIAQLIGGNTTDSNATQTPFVERLNNKRNYKKW